MSEVPGMDRAITPRNTQATAEPPQTRETLLAAAARPDAIVSVALAGVLAARWRQRGTEFLPLYGLDVDATRNLVASLFPGVESVLPRGPVQIPHEFDDALELGDLLDMLLEHRTVADDDSRWLAHAVTTSCVGADHLWQDMNLPSRAVLSKLLHGAFTSLAARNVRDMKWKKFFYLCLCERAQIRVCKAPSCGACDDYTFCFGPET